MGLARCPQTTRPALRSENELNGLEPRAMIAIAARLAVRVTPLVSASDESRRTIERLFELASGTSEIDPKIPKGSGSGPPEFWGRADDVLRRCEQTAQAFGENEPSHEVTDDVRLFVASLVDDAIRTAISFEAPGGGEFLAKAIAHDLSATEKTIGTGTDRMGRPIDPSCKGALGPYWPAGRPQWWPSDD
jgi:hypothetical protein